MLPSLLTTKLFFPPLREGLVSRPRLVDRLKQGMHLPLTLISAPAGSGKSTLLSTWRAGVGSVDPAAWLTLDAGDNDPRRFFTYLARALETLQEGLLASTQFLLSSPQQESIETILTSLINDLASFPSNFTLILDDYHCLTSPAIQAGVAYLLDHQPPQMHLVILTRHDPPLPLSRLRARAQLLEIRAADLRFNSQEAVEFFNIVVGLGLSQGDIDALEQRIEGWAAGLQLAATALQARQAEKGSEEIHSFVSAFTGSHHYIVEYLVEEVLNQQPKPVQDFLLKTSILERLNEELCEFILGDQDHGIEDFPISDPFSPGSFFSARILAYLDKANLFLVPLDAAHTWFRYHPLFAEVLRGRLKQSQPGLLPVLHQRAVDWFMSKGLIHEAMQHALAVGDKNLAAELMEKVGWTVLMRGEWTTLAVWIQQLSEEVWLRPGLTLIQAWIFTLTGERVIEEPALLSLEQMIESDMNLSVETRAAYLGKVVALRGLLAYYRGDARAAVVLCRQALTGLTEENLVDRGLVAHILGESSNRCGDLQGAIQANREAKCLAKIIGGLTLGISAMTALGDLQMAQGNLHAALEEYEEALRFVTRQDGKHLLPAGRVMACISKVYIEWNDLEAAKKSIQECLELCRQGGDVEYLVIGHAWATRLRMALDDQPGALDAIREAARLVREHQLPATTVSLVENFQRRVELAYDPPSAFRWAEKCGLKTTDELSFIREWEYRSLVRVVALQGDYSGALSLLQRLMQSAEAAGRWGWVIHYLVSQAVIQQLIGDQVKAEAALKQALILGKPANYRRVFLDEGETMRLLLARLKVDKKLEEVVPGMLAYIDGLLEDFGHQFVENLSVRIGPGQDEMIERLSERELEVLRLVAVGKTNQEIAKELFLAVGTVKRHLNNIFGKLGVQNRTACVVKARGIGLI